MTMMDVKDAMFHFASAPHRSMDQYTMIVFDSRDTEPPSFDQVAAHVEHRARLVPRLGIRICEAPGQWEFPRWIRDPHPVRDHLVNHDLSDGRHTVESFLAELSSVPIDATDRAWKIHVGQGLSEVDGVRGAATVVVVQISHAMSDGSVGTHIARALFGRADNLQNTESTALPDPVASRARPRYDAAKGAVLLPLRWARSQIPMVRAQKKYLAAVRDGELVVPAPVEAARFNAHPDETRAVHVLQFPKSQWTGGPPTVTVTALTAVGSAMAEYFAAHGEPDRDDLRALVPTALSTSVPWPAVNRTLPAAVTLHPQLADATRRASAVGEALAQQREHVTDHRHLDATRSAEVYPAALMLGFGRHGRRTAPRTGTPDRVTTHTVVTSVNRTSLDLTLGSARAQSCSGVAALGPGCSVSHAVYGYGDLVTVCVAACPTTVPDHAEYANMLRSAIDETCAALHGTATTAVRR
ncbi:wax ester/triacylglycerol synthase domain-containing protein [Rhodococcus sp. IEGM1428]|uniref:wax ester/triacylglycerol synthase domain-containing protein n=1 Tax=Rhodococcus sp. IEGM1428 TaxID=3392191 RepID=UPI003D0D09E8